MNRMSRIFSIAIISAFSLSFLSVSTGCGGKNKKKARSFVYPVEVYVKDEAGRGVPAVPVYLNGNQIGKTDKNGRFSAKYKAKRGKKVSLMIGDKKGYRYKNKASLKTPLQVKKSIGTGKLTGIPIELRVQAKSLINRYLAWIKLSCEENGKYDCSQVPVTFNGKKKTQTLEDGIAHFSFKSSPGDKVKIGLNFGQKKPEFKTTLGLDSEVLRIEYSPSQSPAVPSGDSRETEQSHQPVQHQPEPSTAPEPTKDPAPEPDPPEQDPSGQKPTPEPTEPKKQPSSSPSPEPSSESTANDKKESKSSKDEANKKDSGGKDNGINLF